MKKVGYAFYVHKSNLNELLNAVSEEERNHIVYVIDIAKLYLFLEFDIVKYDRKTSNVSLISCPTWDDVNEPIVGDSYCFNSDLSYKVIKGGTKVYHNKWQFVSEDYKGFNIEKSKERTRQWNSIPNIKELKCKVGYKDFWYQLLKENNMPIYVE